MKAYIFYRQLYNATGTELVIGGVETYFLALFNVLKKAGYLPIMIQCASKEFSILHDENILVRGYPVKGRNYLQKLYSCIERELNDDDLVIFGTNIYAPKVKHRKALSIQHGIDFDYYPIEEKKFYIFLRLGLGSLIKWYHRRREIKSFKATTYHVCVDYNFWNWFRTFSLPKQDKNIFIIPNSAIVPENYPQRDMTNSVVKVLFARRFVLRRGVGVMIKAIELLNQMGVEAEYTFAGTGPWEKEIDQLIDNYPNITKTRYKASEVVTFCQQYDIAVIPTIGAEGTSFSLLEAMAAGNAIVCTPVGGMSNIVQDGYNGVFVTPDSEIELANAIAKLVKNPQLRFSIGQKAYDTVKIAFSRSVWENKWLEALKQIK